ncbi:hypothetical protein D9M68_717090 [compost metagenome]
MLVGDFEPHVAGQFAHFGLAHAAQREAQEIELALRGGKQEIGLVALGIDRPEQLPPSVFAKPGLHIMAGGQHVGAEVARHFHQVDELDRLVAGNARHRRFALLIGIGKGRDHALLEALFIVEHVMGNTQRRRHAARVVDILASATGTLAVRRFAMIVKLQGNADDVIALTGQQARHDRRIHATGHRDNNARVFRALGNIKRDQHSFLYPGGFKGQRTNVMGFYPQQRVVATSLAMG